MSSSTQAVGHDVALPLLLRALGCLPGAAEGPLSGISLQQRPNPNSRLGPLSTGQTISIKRSGLASMSGQLETASAEASEEPFSFSVPIQLKRRGIEAKLVIETADVRPSPPDIKLVALLADARRWVNDLAQGRVASVRDLALQCSCAPSEVSRTLSLAFLAPPSSWPFLMVVSRSTSPHTNSSAGLYPYDGPTNAVPSGSRTQDQLEVAWSGSRIGAAKCRQRLLPKSATNDLRMASLGEMPARRTPKMPDAASSPCALVARERHGVSGSGRGTRTPDTWIMIPLL
jgi:hypothetical protein